MIIKSRLHERDILGELMAGDDDDSDYIDLPMKYDHPPLLLKAKMTYREEYLNEAIAKGEIAGKYIGIMKDAINSETLSHVDFTCLVADCVNMTKKAYKWGGKG